MAEKTGSICWFKHEWFGDYSNYVSCIEMRQRQAVGLEMLDTQVLSDCLFYRIMLADDCVFCLVMFPTGFQKRVRSRLSV